MEGCDRVGGERTNQVTTAGLRDFLTGIEPGVGNRGCNQMVAAVSGMLGVSSS
jgi:hypothetical protein